MQEEIKRQAIMLGRFETPEVMRDYLIEKSAVIGVELTPEEKKLLEELQISLPTKEEAAHVF